MKAQLNEYYGRFSIDLTPETPEEVVKMLRFGLNSTKEIRSKSVFVSGNVVKGSVVLGKRARCDYHIGGK